MTKFVQSISMSFIFGGSSLRTVTVLLLLLLLQVGPVWSKGEVKNEKRNSNLKAMPPKSASQSDAFVNEWAVHIPGGQSVADTVAEDLGYENFGQVTTPLLTFYSIIRANVSYNMGVVLMSFACGHEALSITKAPFFNF